MYLFILESIGTSELILIGIVALIFLGPRKLPQIARKIGKVMAEFRSTTSEFKSTWEREVSLEEEEKALLANPLADEPIARGDGDQRRAPEGAKREKKTSVEKSELAAPKIREIDSEAMQKNLFPESEEEEPKKDAPGKQDWL